MKFVGVFLRWAEPVSFDGLHVQEHRAIHLGGITKQTGQSLHIMAVHGTHILEAHVFKHTAGQKAGLHALLDPVNHLVKPTAHCGGFHHFSIGLFGP